MNKFHLFYYSYKFNQLRRFFLFFHFSVRLRFRSARARTVHAAMPREKTKPTLSVSTILFYCSFGQMRQRQKKQKKRAHKKKTDSMKKTVCAFVFVEVDVLYIDKFSSLFYTRSKVLSYVLYSTL